MSKFMQRLTSLFLSTLLALTSIPVFISIQEPIVVHAMTNNNMVWGTQDYVDLSKYSGSSDSIIPEYQMLRFSLIKAGESTDPSVGFISTEVSNNLVSIANPNGRLKSYNDSVYPYQKVRQLVNKTRYDAYSDGGSTVLYNTGHVLNTRRDYTQHENGTLAYRGKTTIYDDPSHPESSGSHEEVAGYEADFVPIYYSAMPQVIAGGTARSSIQGNPPADHQEWKTIEPSEFFYEYTQTSFIPTGSDVNVSITKPVPDCIYRILAFMLGKSAGSYASQANFDEVESAYNDLIASGKCEIQVEPLQCFQNTGGGGVIDMFFNSGFKYVVLSSAEVDVLNDNASSVNYSYTDQNSLDKGDPSGNNYNFFTSPKSPLADACKNLYNSLLLKNSAWECRLWAFSYGIDNGSLTGAGNRFAADLHTSDNSHLHLLVHYSILHTKSV